MVNPRYEIIINEYDEKEIYDKEAKETWTFDDISATYDTYFEEVWGYEPEIYDGDHAAECVFDHIKDGQTVDIGELLYSMIE